MRKGMRKGVRNLFGPQLVFPGLDLDLLGACPTLACAKNSSRAFGSGGAIGTQRRVWIPPKLSSFANVGQAPRQSKTNI